jgi:hypothetical protein
VDIFTFKASHFSLLELLVFKGYPLKTVWAKLRSQSDMGWLMVNLNLISKGTEYPKLFYKAYGVEGLIDAWSCFSNTWAFVSLRHSLAIVINMGDPTPKCNHP